jgi:glycosyltransferase involved in cell wall biosynthesis
MEKIPIVIILPSLAGGGAERVIINLVENLDRKYFNISLILINNVGPLIPNIPNSEIINLNINKFRNSIPVLLKKISLIKPKVILSTFPHITLSLLFLRPFFFKNCVFISREPNMVSPSLDHSSFSNILKVMHKYLLPKADRIIVTSNAMKKDLINRGVCKSKLFLIYNPIDSLKLRNIKNIIRDPGEGLRLISVGRLVKQKGYDRLIPLLKDIKNIQLTILGTGPELNNLINLTKLNNIEDQVSFLGYIKNPSSYIVGADYFILPSRWEGLPNSALESLVLGTPVISFIEVVALKDIVPLVPKGNLLLCSHESAMKKLLNTLKVRKNLKKLNINNELLIKYNTPKQYAKIFLDMIKGI